MSIDEAHFAQRLRAELADNARALNEAQVATSTVQLDQSSVGRLSRMDAMQQQAMALGLKARLQTRTRQIEAALARVEAGSYGLCCECGDDVPIERLDLDPASVFCAPCAQSHAKG